MSDCATLIAAAGSGLGPTLMAVDCMTASAGAGSFGRVLGPQGVLAPALTAALTIYVAAYGLALITGRVRLGLGGLSGRMLGIGLVLAFATSWVVYGPLVYGLATSAPDEVAGAILGSHGSATATFAQRIDTLFAAVGDATREAAQQDAERNAQLAAQPQVPGAPPVLPPRVNTSQTAGFAPASVAMMGALVLLLSTVGVLVTARIVLAALLLVGPVFVVMALFAPVRGLFGGWLRTLVLAALAPMLVVLGGAFSLELALPTVARLLGPDGIDQAAATGFFLIATVHAALMVMALRAAATMVAGWKPWAPAPANALTAMPRTDPASMVIATPTTAQPGTRTTLAGTRSSERETGIARSATRQITTRETTGGGLFAPAPATPAPGARRAAGIGSRFRPAATRMVVK